MKKFFAYTRVSTARQGEQGVSLQQQRDSIQQFSARTGLEIFEWLEEQETAAKLGRPVFSVMLKRLKAGEAQGVIMHKIDRSARNLKDWAELGQLIDQGITVHFSNESVDLTSRGGRLSADIQAVVAADYIRNLREEVKKGFYGRLKQGLTPMPAPLGYLDNGAGKPKTVDPLAGPIVREAFHLYSTGRYTLYSLTQEVNQMGLRTRRGQQVSVNVVARILSNAFYIGLIRIRRSGDTYEGVHERLISPSMFRRVQDVLHGKRVRGSGSHEFRFSRLITCEQCGRSLVGETKKGYTYYRCHRRTCIGTNLREQDIEAEILKKLQGLQLAPQEITCIDGIVAAEKLKEGSYSQNESKVLRLRLGALNDRQSRLTDAYVDGVMEKLDFEQRKTALLEERSDIEYRLAQVEAGSSEQVKNLELRVALIKSASLLYEQGLSTETRDLITEVVSHRSAHRKTLMIAIKKPLCEVAKRPKSPSGGPVRGEGRNFWREWLLGDQP